MNYLTTSRLVVKDALRERGSVAVFDEGAESVVEAVLEVIEGLRGDGGEILGLNGVGGRSVQTLQKIMCKSGKTMDYPPTVVTYGGMSRCASEVNDILSRLVHDKN